jgi:glycine cleavage system H protein
MTFPADLRYTTSHEWVRVEGGVATVGITDHAQAELGDVVYLDLPKPGRACAAGNAVAVIESVKAASDIYAPLGGEVIESNKEAAGNTGLVNTDPYGAGWLFKMRPADPTAVTSLLDAAAYQAHIGQ